MTLDRRTFVTAGAALGTAGLAVPEALAGALGHASPAKTGQITLTYVMPAPIEKTWHAFTDASERKTWFGFAQDSLKGALDVRPGKSFRSVVDHPGLPGPLEMSNRFESVPGGTRVTLVQSGYGDTPEWQNARETSTHGIHEMMSDLALYLRTGVGYPRHTVFRCFDFLKGTREVPGGIEVFEVIPGTLGAELGLQPGDTVVGLGGAGIFDFAEVQVAARAYQPGDIVEVVWVRGAQLMRGKGKMTRTVSMRNGQTMRVAPPK